MASVTSIRSGLQTRLNTITGLTAHAVVKGQIVPPAAVVEVESISFDATMGRGSDDFLFTVKLLVSASVTAEAQAKLDGYLAGSGATTTVKGAVEADGTLGGVVHFARVDSVRQYGLIEYAGVQYVGCEFLIEVTA
jgi:hypothetical protein